MCVLCVCAEQEVEDEAEEEVVRKKKYSTLRQQHAGWNFAHLSGGPAAMGGVFYPLSSFAIYKDSFFYNSGKPIDFPTDLLVSENYYHKARQHTSGSQREESFF